MAARNPSTKTRTSVPPSQADGPFALETVELRFANDTAPGIRRVRTPDGFEYRTPDGALIGDDDELTRIRRLAIPPAWEDVWISPDPLGHLQATGRDARGRKQYRYHAQWRVERDEVKYARMIEFGRALPRIRKRVEHDLARRGLDRQRVLATIVRLLETTYIRIGNERYARDNKSYGLTTLRTRHVAVEGTRIKLRFRGKAGQMHEIGVRDRRLAPIVKRIHDLPGQELFQYVGDDGELHSIESSDVNDYLREAAGIAISAKDFRTWAGTLLAFRALRVANSDSSRAAKKIVKESTELVAEALGNTPAVSKSAYIAPRVVDAYLSGDLPRALTRASEASDQLQPGADRGEELALVRLLETNAAAVAGRSAEAKPRSASRQNRINAERTSISRPPGRGSRTARNGCRSRPSCAPE